MNDTNEKTLSTPLLSGKLLEPGLSKKELEVWADYQIQEMIASQPTIPLLEQVKRIQTVASVMEEALREAVKKEYAGNPGNYQGLHIAFTGGRKKLDYSRDVVWNRLATQLSDREELLKGLKEPIQVFDEQTGELLTAYPPLVTYGKESISITLR